ncbi:unnamed protein product [Jaminaea pallidilutea]
MVALTRLLVVISALATSSLATISVSRSLADQYPQVAHVGSSYTWTFSAATFADDQSADSALQYASKGLPSWAKFNAASRTFSGTPSDDDVKSSTVTVTATAGQSHAQDQFQLIVVSNPAPSLQASLVQQLPTASSLGRSQIIDGTKLHIPWGWSFSVGWQGSTFSLPNYDRVFTYGTIGDHDQLPSWLHYSPDTFAMWGNAPNVPGPEGTEFVFTLTGANVAGKFGGTSTSISIVLGEGKLSTSSTSGSTASALPVLNATVGEQVNYTIPLSAFTIDGQQVKNAVALNFSADISSTPWLTYDPTAKMLTGTPPSTSSSDVTNTTVPVTATNSLGKSLTTSLSVSVFPPVFTNATLPNVFVKPGQDFNVSLADYVRYSAQHSLSVTFSPSDASQWISFNSTDLILAGTAPQMGSTDKVMVTMSSQTSSESTLAKRDASMPANKASFFIAPEGSSPGAAPPPTDGNGGNDGGSGGLSHKGRIILGVVLGVVLGLLLLALLIFLARRYLAGKNRDNQSQSTATVVGKSPALSDDRTLYGPSPAVGAAAWSEKKGKGKDESPYANQQRMPSPYGAEGDEYRGEPQSPGNELKGILVGGRNYGYADGQAEREDSNGSNDKPQQHGFMAALVQGAKKRFPSSRSLSKDQAAKRSAAPPMEEQSKRSSTGLGLSGLNMDEPETEDAYAADAADQHYDGHARSHSQGPGQGQGHGHSRSKFSLRSSVSKESWEEDLFYTDDRRSRSDLDSYQRQQQQQNQQQGTWLTPVIEVDEVPTRRGAGGHGDSQHGNLRVSSRSSQARHRNSHLNTSPAFNTPATFNAPASEESAHSHEGQSVESGEPDLAATTSDNYVIGTAQRVDVRDLSRQGSIQSHRPSVTEGHYRSQSSHANTYMNDDGAFDDAEDEEQLGELAAMPKSRSTAKVSQAPNRNSVMSTMTTNSQLEALSPYISYSESNPDRLGASQSHVRDGLLSPRPPSFFGGSSISSNIRPEETLRAIPTTPGSPRKEFGGHPAAPMPPRTGLVENLEANVCMGERVRIKLTPPGGAAMRGGAPGSPGKRSSPGGKYIPVVDDISLQAHGTWPIWLSEWLHWDPMMFELSGEVPLDFELPEIHVALVNRRAGDANTTVANVDDEVVVRLTLYIDWPVGVPTSGQSVALRREGTGNAF